MVISYGNTNYIELINSCMLENIMGEFYSKVTYDMEAIYFIESNVHYKNKSCSIITKANSEDSEEIIKRLLENLYDYDDGKVTIKCKISCWNVYVIRTMKVIYFLKNNNPKS